MSAHQYFENRPSKWDILDFLEKCDAGDFEKKLGLYLASLENIANSDEGSRSLKAQKLLERYREGTRPDRKRARDWRDKHSKPATKRSVHFHRPIISSSVVGINDGTVFRVSEPAGKKRRMEVNEPECIEPPMTPPQGPRNLTPLLDTPEKRPVMDERIQQCYDEFTIICTKGKTVAELAAEIGEELAQEVYSINDVDPPVWTPALETHIDKTLKKPKAEFKEAALKTPDVDDDELFGLYCEKILVDFFYLVDVHPLVNSQIGERKYIIHNLASLFKYYETTFSTLSFDWVESHARACKIMKSSTNSGIVKVDAQARRFFDGLDVWHMEVSGPPLKGTEDHIFGDTKKSARTDILNLVKILRNHLDCPVTVATKIKVLSTHVIGKRMTLYALNMLLDGRFLSTELASATMPFSFSGRSQYKSVLRLMARFHDEIMKQEELMIEINTSIFRPTGVTVRDVLELPGSLM